MTIGLATVKSGGVFTGWIYSKEGNELYLKITSVLRKIGPKCDSNLVHIFSFFASILVYIYVHTINEVVYGLNHELFMSDYLKNILRPLKFKHVQSVIFDQLIPSIAIYSSRGEVADLISWSERLNFRGVDVGLRHGNGWYFTLRKN